MLQGGTSRFCREFFTALGMEFTFVDFRDTENIRKVMKLIKRNTKIAPRMDELHDVCGKPPAQWRRRTTVGREKAHVVSIPPELRDMSENQIDLVPRRRRGLAGQGEAQVHMGSTSRAVGPGKSTLAEYFPENIPGMMRRVQGKKARIRKVAQAGRA